MDKPLPFELDQTLFLKEHFNLPPLPESVLKIQEIMYDPDVSIDIVCNILIKEPVLVAQILKVVNSAYYGLRREVDDIRFAVAYLGLNEIFNMVISISVVKNLGVAEKAEIDKFWTHSVLTAICAKHLGKRFEPLLAPDKIWLGALLHDVGKLVFYRFFPDHYKAVLEHREKNGCLFSQAEKALGYPGSALMGSILCERWRMPVIVKDACEHHLMEDLDSPGEGSKADYRRLISSANLMAELVSNGLNHELKQAIFGCLQNGFNLTEKEFLKLMGEVYELKLDLAKYEWA